MKQENRLFSQIEDTLYSYEEAYIPGAWEEFQKNKKRRRMAILFFRIGSAAAILLLFSYVAVQFFIDNSVPVKLQQQHVKAKMQQYPVDSVKADQPITNKTSIAIPDKIAKIQHPINIDKSVAGIEIAPSVVNKSANNNVITEPDPAHVEKDVIIANQKTPVVANESTNPAVAIPSGITALKPISKDTKITRPVYDSIVNQLRGNNKDRYIAKNAKDEITKSDNKNFIYSVVISPSMGNQKVNFGTGVEVAYRITDNLFINSGISYSSMHATTANGIKYADASPSPSTSSFASNSRKIQGVNLAISGFEVPLGLQYRTKTGFYASAGVLALGVVKDRLAYDYIVDRPVSMAAVDANGLTQQFLRVASEKTTEESPEKLNRYLGFYMFSIGKKKTIGNNQLNFGPFVKIPFGGVSSENIKLMQGGVHIGFGF